jgi:hypothetical protein
VNNVVTINQLFGPDALPIGNKMVHMDHELIWRYMKKRLFYVDHMRGFQPFLFGLNAVYYLRKV